MDVFKYIDKYGSYDFNKEPFNDVDAAIFSFLPYVDFNGVVDKKKISLSDACILHKKLHKEINNELIACKDATKMFYYLMNTKRYSNCLLYNYYYVGNDDVQFGAICIKYNKNDVFISYEGTDLMVSGWHENLVLCYEYPSLSHRMAIDYLNKNFLFNNDNLIIGGHSKGGNLALVASINCNMFVKKKIKKIYSMDGPGLLPKVLNSVKYKSIQNRYIHVIPHNSYVGILLESSDDYVIKSNKDGFLAHDFLYWDISDNFLTKASLSSFSKRIRGSINGYLSSLSLVQLKNTIYNFDYIFGKLKIKSFSNFTKDKKRLLKFVDEIKRLDVDSRKILLGLLEVIFNSIGGAARDDFREWKNNLKRNIFG